MLTGGELIASSGEAHDLPHQLADAIGAEETLQALQHAAGFLRSRLSHSLRVRQVPELRFVYDESVERGLHLSRLIDEATKPDGPAGRG